MNQKIVKRPSAFVCLYLRGRVFLAGSIFGPFGNKPFASQQNTDSSSSLRHLIHHCPGNFSSYSQ